MDNALAPRWRGQHGRLEVFYATLSDPETGMACWVHHETVSPRRGAPFAHGWTAVFRPGRTPVAQRFGPVPAAPVLAEPVPTAPESGGPSPQRRTGPALLAPPVLRGRTERLSWDLRWHQDAVVAPTLFTFPAWAWARELLPAAQVVPVPSASFTGSITVDGDDHHLSAAARGAVAHIYGHGNAQRWGWLHAELGGGDVLEVVSAVSRAPVLSRLAPLAFVQLRLGGRDWPRDALWAAPLFRTELGLPTWSVDGTVGRWHLRAEVTLPPAQSVRVAYRDPDGADALCTNSERADAVIVLEERAGRPRSFGRWELRGDAHAEVGWRA